MAAVPQDKKKIGRATIPCANSPRRRPNFGAQETVTRIGRVGPFGVAVFVPSNATESHRFVLGPIKLQAACNGDSARRNGDGSKNPEDLGPRIAMPEGSSHRVTQEKVNFILALKLKGHSYVMLTSVYVP